jgi:hypothetical protein
MPDREKKKQQGDFMSRREMNYAKKVTKKISDRLMVVQLLARFLLVVILLCLMLMA